MIEFITAPQNLPFSVALAVMLGIALLEGITALFGAALSGLLDALIPDLDVDVDLDLSDVEAQSPTPLSRLLGWLRIGKVPVLILLVIFLTGFGLVGYGIQSVTHGLTGHFLPSYIASIPAFLLALPIVRVLGGVIGAVMPKDETEAVSEDSLVGRIATITLGTAKTGSPAEARVKDQFGTAHYVMVEPDLSDVVFPTDTVVLLVKKNGHIFKAIRNKNQNLVDE